MSLQNNAVSTEIVTTARPPRRRQNLFWLLTEEYRHRVHKSSELLMDLLFGLLACALTGCHALFGVYPFSIALLCAVRRRVLPVLVGAAVGCYFLGAAGVLYLCVLMAVFVLRVLVSYPCHRRLLPESPALFEEEPQLRICLCLMAGLGMAIYELAVGGLQTHTLLFALGALLLPAVICFFYLGVFASSVDHRMLLGRDVGVVDYGRVSPVHFQIGGLLLLFSLSLSLRKLEFFGISVANAVAAASVLLVARRFGALRGCVAGLVVGLAGTLTYLPCFALLGLLSGACFSVGMPCALSAAVVAAGGYAVYVGGLSGFLAVVPELAVTSLLLWPYLRTLRRAEHGFFQRPIKAAFADPPQEAPPPEADGQIAALSSVFLSLAAALHRAADGDKTPEKEEYSELCATVKGRYCRKCPKGTAGSCGSVDQQLEQIVERLYRGEEGATEAPIGVREDCEALPRMREEIRSSAAVLVKRHRRRSAGDVFSADYSLVARVLDEISEREKQKTEEDGAASETLRKALAEAGVCARSVSVQGRHHRVVRLGEVSWDGGEQTGERIRRVCEAALGGGLSAPVISYDGRNVSCSLHSERRFSLSRAVASCAKIEGQPSGDAVCVFEDGDGFGHALLSDGMGSGPRAARTAELCVSFLSELLRAGVSHQTALRMLNNTISGGEESSATVDLFRIDPADGRASFIKSGAAVSFVARGDQLFRVRARTVPIGLLKSPDAEEIAFEAQAGDVVIMLSDGAVRGKEDGGRLKELLAQSRGDLSALAANILSAARAEHGNADDMTVLVLRVDDGGGKTVA